MAKCTVCGKREVPVEGAKCKFCLWGAKAPIGSKKQPKEKTKKARKKVIQAQKKRKPEKISPRKKCPKRPPLIAKLESLEFLSDHTWNSGMTENGKDVSKQKMLRPSPDAKFYPFTYDTRLHFEKPEWTRKPAKSDPISHNRNKKIEVNVTVSFKSKGKYKIRKIYGKPLGKDQKYMEFKDNFTKNVKKKLHEETFKLTSLGKLPKTVCDLSNHSVTWYVYAEGHGWKGWVKIGVSGPHRIYVTFDKPKVEKWKGWGWQGWWPEDGVTCARMERAIAMVQPMNTDNTHKIANTIRTWFRVYVLKSDLKAAPYGHSVFFKFELGGAWCLSDFIKKGGECQAIVRLIRAVLNQLGCSGKWIMHVVYASPYNNEGKVAIEGEWPQDGGLNDRSKYSLNDGKKNYYVSLMDDYKMFNWYQVHKDARGNTYEAALRVTDKGKTYYYAGGAYRFTSAQDILQDFSALIWRKNDSIKVKPPRPPLRLPFCAQVIQRYDHKSNKNPGPLHKLKPPQWQLPPGKKIKLKKRPAEPPALGPPINDDDPKGECKAPTFSTSAKPNFKKGLPCYRPPLPRKKP
jgi:hypothetical protein